MTARVETYPAGTDPGPVDAFRDWLGRVAFPYWAEHGQAGATGVFAERLDAAGRADLDVPRRVRNQARQTFAFATAARCGWADTGALAKAGGEHLLSACADPQRPGRYFHGVDPQGRVRDASSDLYEQACVILAFSSLFELSGEPRWHEAARDALDYVRTGLGHPAMGYAEADPPRLPRRQNPHMHMLESCLALYRASGQTAALEEAAAMVALFDRAFYDDENGVLLEYFDDELAPWQGRRGQVVEPGHEMEWVWLLAAYGEISGAEPHRAIGPLFAHALEAGINGESGLLCDAVGRDGTVLSPSSRLWPQTERIKAEFAMARAGRHSPERAMAALAHLHRTFFSRTPEGVWYDLIDGKGRPVPGPMPASALYHLTSMMLEIERFSASGSPS